MNEFKVRHTGYGLCADGLEADILFCESNQRYGIKLIDVDAGQVFPHISYQFEAFDEAIMAARNAIGNHAIENIDARSRAN